MVREPVKSQGLEQLSRNTEHANDGAVSPIFNKQKEQKRLQAIGLISEIASQASDIARTQGEINALALAREQYPGKSVKELKKTQIYRDEQAKYGTGSDIQRGIQTASAALQGLAGGSLTAAVAGAAAPELANIIGHHLGINDNTVAKTAAHTLLGGAVAVLQGNNAIAGAAGAASAELATHFIMAHLYSEKTVSDLNESERQTLTTLASLTAGAAGGILGDSSQAVAVAMQSGKNVVENNYLSNTQAVAFDKELSDCRQSGGDCQEVIDKWKKVSDEQSAVVDERLENNPLTAVGWDKEVAQGGYDMTERPGWLGNIGADVMTSGEAKAYVQQWNGQDLENIDVNSPTWTKFAVFASDPENQAMLVSGGLLAKNLVQLAKSTVTNLSQGGIPFAIKSMQVGLRNPQPVDKLKNDMVSGNYKFTAPEGRIAGYIDSKGNYYISEGNHRMVAAQEIYKKTGNASYIEKLIQNGSWTQTKNAPAEASSMSTRK